MTNGQVQLKSKERYGFVDKIKPFCRGLAKLRPLYEIAVEGLRRGNLSGEQRKRYELRVATTELSFMPIRKATGTLLYSGTILLSVLTLGTVCSLKNPAQGQTPSLKGFTSELRNIKHGIKNNVYHFDFEIEMTNNNPAPIPNGTPSSSYSVCFYIVKPKIECCIAGGSGGNISGLAKGQKRTKKISKMWGNGKSKLELCADGSEKSTCVSIRGQRPDVTVFVGDIEKPLYEKKQLLTPIGDYK